MTCLMLPQLGPFYKVCILQPPAHIWASSLFTSLAMATHARLCQLQAATTMHLTCSSNLLPTLTTPQFGITPAACISPCNQVLMQSFTNSTSAVPELLVCNVASAVSSYSWDSCPVRLQVSQGHRWTHGGLLPKCFVPRAVGLCGARAFR